MLQNLFHNHVLHLALILLHYVFSDAQIAFLSGNLFSEVLIHTPVPSHIRLPEFYTAEHSRPAPNFADYPLRNDSTTIYDPKNDPIFQFLQNALLQLTIHYRRKENIQKLKDSKLLT